MSFFVKEEKHESQNWCGQTVTETEKTVRVGRIIAVSVAAILAIILIFSSFTVVKAGHTGVVSTFGKVSEDVLQEGFHFKAPWQKVTNYDRGWDLTGQGNKTARAALEKILDKYN